MLWWWFLRWWRLLFWLVILSVWRGRRGFRLGSGILLLSGSREDVSWGFLLGSWFVVVGGAGDWVYVGMGSRG